MSRKKTNLVLIGMPGSGKSTVGVILAKRSSRSFVDTDVLIQSHEQRSLQDIVDRDGYLALRRIEEAVLLSLDLQDCVISTGGSAVYSDAAMHHLAQDSRLIFLDVSLAGLLSRVTDMETRGIAKRPEQSFAELFAERCELYARYADLTIACDGLSQEQVCERIMDVFPYTV
ncbi:MAG: shikimate kinase [Pseudomonadales bacterium]|nr:shikimate kinase [Pseudomonadales bacterium]